MPLLSKRLAADLLAACHGLSRYDYTVSGILTHEGRPVKAHALIFGDVHALSASHAIALISANHPDHPICSLKPASGICIKLLVTYPCRAARWVWSYRQLLRLENEALRAALLIQTRKAVLVKLQSGRDAIQVDIPADAPEPPPVPLYAANGTLGIWKAVALNHHG